MNEEYGGDFVTIVDEDGQEFELEILDTLEMDGKTYTVFAPADIEDMDVNDPDYGLIILRTTEEDGEEVYDSVDDEEELERVYNLYQEILDAEEEASEAPEE